MTVIRVALRDWDWLTPLLLDEHIVRDFTNLGAELEIDRVATLDSDWLSHGYSAAEVSLSRTSRDWAMGRLNYDPAPILMMQGFRHRCVLVKANSDFQHPRDLIGKRIGLTGWADSGNTWTRAVLEEEGLSVNDAHWLVGRLTDEHPETDRLEGFGQPGRIDALHGKPMIERLAEGTLDAILTPFMPPGFYSPQSKFRHLYPNVRRVEQDWANTHGYVPGHHIIGFDPSLPHEIRQELVKLLMRSRAEWRKKREKYSETSTWLAVDFYDELALPEGWDVPYSVSQTRMFNSFFEHQRTQSLISQSLDYNTLFNTKRGKHI